MPFPAALSAANKTSLRGNASTNPTYSARQYLSLNANTTVFKALVNQATFTASFAQVTFDTVTTGAYTDIEVGQTVYIYDPAASKRAPKFIGRVRKTPTSTVLYINETSASLADNDVIEVIDDYRLHEKLGRDTGGVQYKDYDKTFAQIPPFVTNLQSAYAGVVSGTPAGLTQRFQPTAIAGTSSASISSYAFTIASGMTVTAGDPNTADVTIRFDAGEYWLKLVVTDSNGLTTTRRIKVWAVPTDFSAQVATGFTGAQLNNDLDNGWNAQIEAFTGISSVLDNTLCCVWEIERYNGTEGPILSSVKFVGRLRRESDTTAADERHSQVQSTGYEIEGPGAQLARITAPLLALRHKASPTVWDQIANMTIWREIVHVLHEHTTFLSLHALTFDDTGTTYRDKIYGTQGENALAVVNDLASGYNAAIEFAPQGESRVVRDARYQASSDRDALTTVLDNTDQDMLDFSLDIEHVETVGRVEASGGSFNTVNGNVTPVLSIAPGVAQGSGEGRLTLARQILTSNSDKATIQSELNTRAGHHLKKENPAPRLVVTHPDGYRFLTASRYQWYTFTIAAGDNTAGRAYTTSDRWLCESVGIAQDNEVGAGGVEATYVLETTGTAGQSVEFPAIEEFDDPYSGIPPLPPYPAFPPPPDIYLPPDPTELPPYLGELGDEPPDDGNLVVFYSNQHVWRSRKFLLSSAPPVDDITPTLNSGESIQHVVPGLARELYVLLADATLSRVQYLADVATTDPNYDDGTLLAGAYTQLRADSTQGSLYVYVHNTSDTAEDFDTDYWLTVPFSFSFSVTSIGNTNVEKEILLDTTYPGAVGILIDWSATQSGAGVNKQVRTDGNVGEPDTWTDSSAYVFFSGGGNTSGAHVFVNPTSEASKFTGYTNTNKKPGLTDLRAATELSVHFGGNYDTGATVTFTGTVKLIIKKSVQPFPGTGFGSTDQAQTRFSSDYGASFGAVRAIGSLVPNFGGLDTSKIGTLALGGADQQVHYAISGGAWSDYGTLMPAITDPNFIHVPRYQFGSTVDSNASTNTPQYLLASGSLSAANAAVWKVTGNGTVLTDITPVVDGTYGVVAHQDGLHMPWFSGQRIAAVLDFAGTKRLMTSEDSGASWTNQGTLTDNARMVAFRKGEKLMNQLFFSDGKPAYSPDYGTTRAYKDYPADPSSEPIVGIIPYG